MTTPVPTPRSTSPGAVPSSGASGGLPLAMLRPRFWVLASGVAFSEP